MALLIDGREYVFSAAQDVATRVELLERWADYCRAAAAALAENRKQGGTPDRIAVPPARKLDFNGFAPDMHDSLLIPMRYVHLVEVYYAGRTDPLERDEVAQGFRQEYLDLSDQCDDPDTIIDQLTEYILGTRTPSTKKLVDARVVLMYFFGQCEIFEVPPPGWQPQSNEHRKARG